jgi:secreted trypsin-like serine protease
MMPWMVSLGNANSKGAYEHICGGSVITPVHILTAGHCFSSIKAG